MSKSKDLPISSVTEKLPAKISLKLIFALGKPNTWSLLKNVSKNSDW